MADLDSPQTVTFENCTAFRNGVDVWNYGGFMGNGNGFKIGGWGTTTPPSSVPVHTVKYCLAANNNAHGFYANHQPGQSANWTNNTAYNNKSANYNMLERVSVTDATDIPGTREVFHYNIAFTGTTIINDNNPAANKTNNSWTKSGVTVSSADFQSTDATQMTTARPSSGALPTITFMKPRVSPFSAARPTRVIGRLPTRYARPDFRAASSEIPARASGGSTKMA